MQKWLERIFLILVSLSLLAPFWVFKDLLFPYITSKAYYFRIVIELALPLYVTLLVMVKRYRPNVKNPLHIFVAAFLVVSFLAGVFGANPMRSFWGNIERMGGVFYLFHLVLLYFYVVLLGTMDTAYIQKFLQWFVFVAAGTAIYGILVWMKLLTFMPDPSYPRISSTFGNPIFFASFLILPMFISMFFVFYEEGMGKKIMYGIFAALMLLGIFSSSTRGAIVGLGVGIFCGAVLYALLTPSKKVKWYAGVSVSVFAALLVTLFFFHASLPQGSMLRRMFTLRDSNTEARLVQWKIALSGFHERVLLGTGPENYYVIANKYYSPELYKYDPSWFDKPHNYLLEILVTSGVVGLLAYLGILIFGVWGLLKAFRAGAISAFESSLLFGGLVVYEIQNLFVFDTISASIAFFVFMALIGFSWYSTKIEKRKVLETIPESFAWAVLGVSSVVALALCWYANITGLQLAKNINYGYAYGSVDPVVAAGYFRKAQATILDFDPVQLGDKYSDFSLTAAQGQQGQTALKTVQDAIDFEKSVTDKVSNDPTVWQRLLSLYMAQATLSHQPLGADADDAINQALLLAPQRPELQMALVRVKLFRGDVTGAEDILQNVMKNFPTDNDAVMQLALLYHYTSKDNLAVPLAEQALQHSVTISNFSQISWLVDYYQKNKQFQKAVALCERLAALDKNDIELYWQLAQSYAGDGQIDKAKNLAESIAQADPSRKAAVDAFVNSLK